MTTLFGVREWLRGGVVAAGLVTAAVCMLAATGHPPQARAASAAPATAAACVTPKQLGLVLVIDDSGSMQQSDATNLRAEAASIAIDQLTAGSAIATSAFASGARALFAPTVVRTTNRDRLKSTVRTSLHSSGGTDYEAAFLDAQRQLSALPATVDRRAVLFLSDGQPNLSTYTADRPIAAAGTPIYTIGFGTASMVELAGISARSGGQHWTAADAASLQHIVGNITAILGCNAQNLTEQVSLPPGGARSIPFNVDSCERELRSLAAWKTGTIDVTLTRPDGTTLDVTSAASWERYVREASYVSVNSTRPQAGGWTLNLSSAQQNLAAVDITINVWGRVCSVPEPVVDEIASPRTCVAVATSRGMRSSVDFSWQAVPRHALLSGYDVQTAHKGGKAWMTYPITTATSMQIDGHNPGSSWTYRVRSSYSDGRSSDWCTVTVTIPVWSLHQGSEGSNKISGARGRDLVNGFGGSDVLDGRAGTDLVHGGRGSDRVMGGIGNDRLTGGAGHDRISGGSGHDTVDARDRRGGDEVHCGAGLDTVFADRADRVAVDCERVRRIRPPRTAPTRVDEPQAGAVNLATSMSYGGGGGAAPVFGNGTQITATTSGATPTGGTVTISGTIVNPSTTNGAAGAGGASATSGVTGTSGSTGMTAVTGTAGAGATTSTTSSSTSGSTTGSGSTTSASTSTSAPTTTSSGASATSTGSSGTPSTGTTAVAPTSTGTGSTPASGGGNGNGGANGGGRPAQPGSGGNNGNGNGGGRPPGAGKPTK